LEQSGTKTWMLSIKVLSFLSLSRIDTFCSLHVVLCDVLYISSFIFVISAW
jgi:hypothetical protein